MIYKNIEEGRFISRPNRFLAIVEMEGTQHVVHVKNTSRCRELLTEGAKVFVEKSGNPQRKTGYSLITVEKDGRLFNIDSQAPNKICLEGIIGKQIVLPGMTGYMETVRTEKAYGDSRLDIYIEERLETGIRKAYIEVKGVTLEEDGVARFPDAPTERGLRHIGELRRIAASGDLAYIIFILQMKGSRSFEPNDRMHPAFGEALRFAAAEGVRPLAYDCLVGPDRIEAADPVPIIF